MADKIKEFVNTTYHLTDVVNDKLNIVTTNATTQAVVKDIVVEMSKSIKGGIEVNGVQLSDSIESMTGSEIVDINSTMYVSVPVPDGIMVDRTAYDLNSYSIRTVDSTTTTTNVTDTTMSGTFQVTTITGTTLSEDEINSTYGSVMTVSVLPNNASVIPTTTTTTTTTVAVMAQPNFVYKHAASGVLYYFYYNGNDTTSLFYSTDNGTTWNTLESTSYSYKCVNISGKITMVGGTDFKYVNAGATTVTGTVALSGRITGNYATSSYTHASECNGWHFWMPNNSYASTLYGYNHTKNIAVTITMNSAMQIGSVGGICVTYNSTTGKYYVFSWNSTTMYLHRIDTDIDALVADGTGTGVNLTTTASINNVVSFTHGAKWLSGTNKMIFVDNTTKKIMSTEFNSTSPYYTTPIVVSEQTSVTGGITTSIANYASAAQHIDVYADYLDTTATIQVRATGIETTL